MKKLVLLAMMLSAGILGYAQDTISVSLTDSPPEEWQSPKKAPAQKPQVAYENQNLFIKSAYAVDLAQIIIRNEDDDIIYNMYMPLPSSLYTIVLPLAVSVEKYSIELKYDGHDYIGWF